MFIDTSFLQNDEIQLKLEKTVDGNVEKDWVPAYHFAICNKEGAKMGVCDLRIGHNDNLKYVIITCNPDNIASRKTCEYAGGELLEVVDLPEDNDMRERGETRKCIFKFALLRSL